MNKQQIEQWMNEVEERMVLIKQEIGSKDSVSRSSSVNVVTKKRTKPRKEGSTKPTMDLIKRGFFDSSKTDVEVIVELRKKALRFDRNDVAVTLMRFVRQGLLEREGGGKDGPWRYKKP